MLLPKFYFYRSKTRSDLQWVSGMMRHIPADKQQEVCDEYERLFLGEPGRKGANEYLSKTAKGYYEQSH